jgi:hypothetical protein
MSTVNKFQNLAAHAVNTAGLDVPRYLNNTVLMQFHKCERDILKPCSDINLIYETWNKLHGKKIFDSINFNGSCFERTVLKSNTKIGLEIM